MTGKISSLCLEDACGIIKSEDGASLPFELSAVLEYDVTCLAVGQTVAFDLAAGALPRAVNVFVRKAHLAPHAEVKSQDSAALRYIGFQQRGSARDYRFERVARGEDREIFTVTTDMALFTRHRVALQDGPSLCLHLLARQFDAASGGPPLHCAVTDDDMLAHLASRPAPGTRSHGKRPPRAAGAGSHLS